MLPMQPNPPSTATLPDWCRKAAGLINGLIRQAGYPFPLSDAEPENPTPGQSYYDTGMNKARTWDGTVWNDLW